MIKVVAFDLDDTLWAVKPIILRAERQLDNWLASNVPRLNYSVTEMRALRTEVLDEAPELRSQITELRRRLIERAMMRSNISAADATLLSGKAMDVFLTARNEVDFFEGALDEISHLSTRFVLGALTNGNADILRLGLKSYFSFAFSAEQVGAPKPAPNLFSHALAYTNVSPAEMIYVGDDPVLDIDTANNLGLRTIWVNSRQRDPGSTQPDVTIDHVRNLRDAVSQIADVRDEPDSA